MEMPARLPTLGATVSPLDRTGLMFINRRHNPHTCPLYPHRMSPLNKCHACGATTYAQVIERDAEGVMRPTGVHRCVGCKQLFTSIETWRNGPPTSGQQHSQAATQSGSVHPG